MHEAAIVHERLTKSYYSYVDLQIKHIMKMPVNELVCHDCHNKHERQVGASKVK